jgi:hypothetical protein
MGSSVGHQVVGEVACHIYPSVSVAAVHTLFSLTQKGDNVVPVSTALLEEYLQRSCGHVARFYDW